MEDLLGILVVLVLVAAGVHLWATSYMAAAAVEKGYPDTKALVWLLAIFSWFASYLFVMALPDRRLVAQNEGVAQRLHSDLSGAADDAALPPL